MTSALFQISTSTSGYTNIKTLAPTAKEPEWSYKLYTSEELLGDLTVRGMGYPVAEWHFGYLTQADYDAFRAFCAGKSAAVYVVTKTDANTYGTYTANMIWPENVRWQNGKAIDITFKFMKMEAV